MGKTPATHQATATPAPGMPGPPKRQPTAALTGAGHHQGVQNLQSTRPRLGVSVGNLSWVQAVAQQALRIGQQLARKRQHLREGGSGQQGRGSERPHLAQGSTASHLLTCSCGAWLAPSVIACCPNSCPHTGMPAQLTRQRSTPSSLLGAQPINPCAPCWCRRQSPAAAPAPP